MAVPVAGFWPKMIVNSFCKEQTPKLIIYSGWIFDYKNENFARNIGVKENTICITSVVERKALNQQNKWGNGP